MGVIKAQGYTSSDGIIFKTYEGAWRNELHKKLLRSQSYNHFSHHYSVPDIVALLVLPIVQQIITEAYATRQEPVDDGKKDDQPSGEEEATTLSHNPFDFSKLPRHGGKFPGHPDGTNRDEDDGLPNPERSF